MNIFKKVSIFAGVILIVGLIVFLNQTNRSKEVLKIGLMAPLSGEYAVAGQNIEKGVELALEQYEKENPSVDIQLIVEDDGFVVQKGITAFKKLKDIDKVDSLIMVSTPVIDAIHEDINKLDFPVIQLGIQTTGVDDDNIFQTSSAPEAPIKLFAQYLDDTYDFKNVAVVYDNTAGGLTFFKSFEETYEGKIDPMIINNKSDIKGHVAKITANNYDSVVFLTSPENGALATKEILNIDTTPPLFAFDAQLQTGFTDYGRILGDTNLLNGSLSIWFKSGDTQKFNDDFKNKFGEEPGFFADFGYDSFNILMGGYSSATDNWINNIQNTKGKGVSGDISFDENGIRLQDIVVNKVVDGKITPIK